jgi:16S rRNA (cytidine1402-2'-O)-methyltransferase
MLTIIGTPIGNLEDLSPRGHKALQAVAILACEDTRRTGNLLRLMNIPSPKLVSLHEHNEAERVAELLIHLKKGVHVGLVSDSGMPTLSDPGSRLVAAAQAAGVPTEVIGGPTALTNALAGSGLVGAQAGHSGFVFLGFPPRTEKARAALFATHAAHGLPLVCYESPNRVQSLCASALKALGNRPAMLARELTKLHETWHGNSLESLATTLPKTLKGECVLVIGGGEPAHVALPTESSKTGLKALAEQVALQLGISNQAAYSLLIKYKPSQR